MSRYILQRVLGMLAVMFVVVTIVFVIVRVAPGDPAAVMLGPDATAQDIAALRVRLGLDRPLAVQYLLFLGQLARGDLGESIFLNRPVLSALADRAEPTFFLTLFAIAIASAIAIPVGVLSAYRRGSCQSAHVSSNWRGAPSLCWKPASSLVLASVASSTTAPIRRRP